MIDAPIRTRTRPAPVLPEIRVRQRPGATVAPPLPSPIPNGASTYEHGGKVLIGYACRNSDGSYSVWGASGRYAGKTPGWDFSAQVALMRSVR